MNIRPGEFAATGGTTAPVSLGLLRPLHVRVDVDEADLPRLAFGRGATAARRGLPGESIRLRFVRAEPILTSKRSLGGGPDERVDTRVLQVLFTVDQQDVDLRPGHCSMSGSKAGSRIQGDGKNGRKPGDRNRDYAETRQVILGRLHACLVPPRERTPSLRELAKAAGVSLPTLKHYFGGRDAVIAAVLEFQGRMGEPYLEHLGSSEAEFEISIREAVTFLAEGLFEARVSDIHAFGLAEGAQSSALGRTYLERLLEPTLQALESRIACHIRRQEMKPVDPRIAALQMAAPLVLASLHQGTLGGADLRPLDKEALCEAVIGNFVHVYKA